MKELSSASLADYAIKTYLSEVAKIFEVIEVRNDGEDPAIIFHVIFDADPIDTGVAERISNAEREALFTMTGMIEDFRRTNIRQEPDFLKDYPSEEARVLYRRV